VKISIILAALVIGALCGISIGLFLDKFLPTKQIALSKDLVGDYGRVLPAGTILRYVADAPEGYIQADMAIAIESDALTGIEIKLNEKAHVRSHYFYSGAKYST